MTKIIRLLLVSAALFAAPVDVSWAGGDPQNAYDACARTFYLNQGRLKGYWAFYSGIGPGRALCFPVANMASQGDANREAERKCRAKFEKCYEFATKSGGLSDWAKGIYKNNGREIKGSGAPRAPMSPRDMEMFGTIIGQMLGSGGLGGGRHYSRNGSGASGGAGYCGEGATKYQCGNY